MRKLLLFLISGALLLVGCSGPRHSVDPEWKDAPKSFSVVVSAPYVSNPDDVTDDFGGEDGFRQWFVAYLDSSLSLATPINHSVKMVDDGDMTAELLPLGKNLVKFPLPDPAKLEDVGGVVLAVHPVRFHREVQRCPSGGCIGNKSLNLQVAYSVVSMENRKVLAYGLAGASNSFTFAMTRGDWEKVVQRVSWQLVEGTPLEK